MHVSDAILSYNTRLFLSISSMSYKTHSNTICSIYR